MVVAKGGRSLSIGTHFEGDKGAQNPEYRLWKWSFRMAITREPE